MRKRAEPLPYQIEAIEAIENNDGRALAALDMGLGKTLISLWCLDRNPDWTPALVVCPASVKYNWQAEASIHLGMKSSVCNGRTPPKRGAGKLQSMAPLYIINYDILQYWKGYLKQLGFKTIICDESQYLSNPKAIRTKAVKSLTKGADNVIMLSGTPLMNRPAELWPTLNMLWPRVFKSFRTFAEQHCEPRIERGRWTYNGATNLKSLNRKLTSIGMIRMRKQDVLKDLPGVNERMVVCPLLDPKEYQRAENDFVNWLKTQNKNKPNLMSLGLVKIGYLLRLAAKLKFKYVVEWINQFLEETDEKLVVMAHHKKAIKVLKKHITAKSVVVDGSVRGEKRQAAVDQFQRDASTRVFIGNIKAAGVGLTLTAASTMVIAELPWRPADLTQAIARINRIGQTETAFVYYMIALGTKEERACEVLQEKQQTVSAVLDGGDGSTDLDIHQLLLKEMMI